MIRWLNDNLVWIGPMVVGAIVNLALWVRSWFKRAEAEAAGKARAEGVAQELARQQSASTAALHARFDHFKDRLERIERITQNIREVLIRADLMIPSDTQTGIQSPLRRKP